MPVGMFLDTLPPILFIAVHTVFLLFGIWVARRAASGGLPYSSAFLLYAVSQIGFLAFFGGLLTLKMSVLLEQMLVFGMVLWVIVARTSSSRASGVQPATKGTEM